jgi:hypothetical protein
MKKAPRLAGWRSDQLILLASLPLVTLVVYLGWQMVTTVDAESSIRPKTLMLPTQSVPEIANETPNLDSPMRMGHQQIETPTITPVAPTQESVPAGHQEDLPILPTEEATVRPMHGHSWSTDDTSVEQAVVRPGEQPLRLGRAEAIPIHVGRIRSIEPNVDGGHSLSRARTGVLQGETMSYAPAVQDDALESNDQ